MSADNHHIPMIPGEFYFRCLYRLAPSAVAREAIFQALARDRAALRQWVRNSFGVEPPKFEVSEWELHDRPPVSFRPLHVCAATEHPVPSPMISFPGQAPASPFSRGA